MKFSKYFDFKRIVFVGAGGTNGYAIPNILRLFATNPLAKYAIEFYIIDPDIVEEKNIIRQNFIESDIGKYKADVLAARYGQAYGIPIRSYHNKIQDKTFHDTIFVEAVDNNMARKYLHDIVMISKDSRNAWLSSGNDKNAGVLVYCDPNRLEHPRTPVDIWPEAYTEEVFDQERQHELENQCALHAISEPQTAAINIIAGAMLTSYFYALMMGDKNLTYDIVIFDRFGNSKVIPFGMSFGAYKGKISIEDKIKEAIEKAKAEKEKEKKEIKVQMVDIGAEEEVINESPEENEIEEQNVNEDNENRPLIIYRYYENSNDLAVTVSGITTFPDIESQLELTPIDNDDEAPIPLFKLSTELPIPYLRMNLNDYNYAFNKIINGKIMPDFFTRSLENNEFNFKIPNYIRTGEEIIIGVTFSPEETIWQMIVYGDDPDERVVINNPTFIYGEESALVIEENGALKYIYTHKGAEFRRLARQGDFYSTVIYSILGHLITKSIYDGVEGSAHKYNAKITKFNEADGNYDILVDDFNYTIMEI